MSASPPPSQPSLRAVCDQILGFVFCTNLPRAAQHKPGSLRPRAPGFMQPHLRPRGRGHGSPDPQSRLREMCRLESNNQAGAGEHVRGATTCAPRPIKWEAGAPHHTQAHDKPTTSSLIESRCVCQRQRNAALQAPSDAGPGGSFASNVAGGTDESKSESGPPNTKSPKSGRIRADVA